MVKLSISHLSLASGSQIVHSCACPVDRAVFSMAKRGGKVKRGADGDRANA